MEAWYDVLDELGRWPVTVVDPVAHLLEELAAIDLSIPVGRADVDDNQGLRPHLPAHRYKLVITSYSIHYTKLYDRLRKRLSVYFQAEWQVHSGDAYAG